MLKETMLSAGGMRIIGYFWNLNLLVMQLHFWKYHGTGNDFILMDLRMNHFVPDTEIIRSWCDRRFGIGADGLILLDAVTGFDFVMKYFNSDGRESTMCGNGGRCAIAFADFLSPISDHYRFLAVDGVHEGMILNRSDNTYEVKLQMGPVKNLNIDKNDIILDTGSPHLVRFEKDIDAMDVFREGRAIRFRQDFLPEGINVNFAEEKAGQLFVRTYERGVEDETLSCGTGVTASALAYAHRHDLKEGMVSIKTPGGSLQVEFKRAGDGFTNIWLTGPASRVFDGSIEV